MPFVAAGAVLVTPVAMSADAAFSTAEALDRWFDSERVIARLARSGVSKVPVRVRQCHLLSAELAREVHEGVPSRRLTIDTDLGPCTWHGANADRALGVLLARLNRVGASQRQVDQALAKIDWFGGSDGVYAFGSRYGAFPRGYEQRLAMEMVSHSGLEREALEGELTTLAAAWREAEEIAAIADRLLEPPTLGERLPQLRVKSSQRQRILQHAARRGSLWVRDHTRDEAGAPWAHLLS